MRFIAIDSSLANTGVALGTIEDDKIIINHIYLLETTKTKNKQVRASSDTIERNRETYKFVHMLKETSSAQVVFMETPSGSQSAAGMKSYGGTCMLIASMDPPAIEVTPIEVKLATVGKKTATKDEMIKWAYEKYPDVEWDKNRDGSLKKKNEHMADAIAIVFAGIKTNQFNQLKSLIR